MSRDRGQASVEWVALVLIVALVLGAVVAFVPVVDGRSLGSSLAHAIVCAARGDCDRGCGGLSDGSVREVSSDDGILAEKCRRP